MIPGYLPFEVLTVFTANAQQEQRRLIDNLKPIKPARFSVPVAKNAQFVMRAPPKVKTSIVPMDAFAAYGSATFEMNEFNYA